jgi:hypothetical protein
MEASSEGFATSSYRPKVVAVRGSKTCPEDSCTTHVLSWDRNGTPTKEAASEATTASKRTSRPMRDWSHSANGACLGAIKK